MALLQRKNDDKYWNIAGTDRNIEVLKKYSEVWNGIKDSIKKYMIVNWEI